MYEKLVFTFPEEYINKDHKHEFVVQPQAYFRGASQIPGSKFNVGFQIFTAPFCIDKWSHRHSEDEYLIFLGGTFPNLFDWDAEVELTLGELGNDAEVFLINKPTIVRIPAGTYHCPLDFKRIDKPVFFQAALMVGMFGGVYEFEDGSREMKFNGPGQCKYNAEKKCDSCGKCLEEDWRANV